MINLRAKAPQDFNSEIHRVITFKRHLYNDVYKQEDDGFYRYQGVSAESSVGYTEKALLALEGVEVVEYCLQ